jgi:pyruvate,water dikinase
VTTVAASPSPASNEVDSDAHEASSEVLRRPSVVPRTRAIVPPRDFTVRWQQPDDAQLQWKLDRLHFPVGTPALVEAIDAEAGLNRAASLYGLPTRERFERINTYMYVATTAVPGSRAGRETLAETSTCLHDLWARRWWPEIQAHLAFWEQFSLAEAPVHKLCEHAEESFTRLRRLMDVHFEIILPVMVAMGAFEDIYRDVMGSGEAQIAAFELLQGDGHTTYEMNVALHDLAREVLASPWLLQVLRTCDPTEVVATLRKDARGAAFLAAFDAFLAVYGRRGETFGALIERSWIEDPSPVIHTLRRIVEQPLRDLRAELQDARATRDRRVVAFRRRLEVYPRPVRDLCEAHLRAAQTATVLSEDHAYWIDFAAQYAVRRVVLECGRRLRTLGIVDQPTDLVHLTSTEILEALREGRDCRQLIRTRLDELNHFAGIDPPLVLGCASDGPEDPSAVDSSDEALRRFVGDRLPVDVDPCLVRGHGCSPGTARGVARVLHTLADAARFRHGDVLITTTTSTSWTPLFVTAAAVVTDTGGPLSHCAVVAREFRVPAVAGTKDATARIRDGQLVEVDGSAGTVRIL